MSIRTFGNLTLWAVFLVTVSYLFVQIGFKAVKYEDVRLQLEERAYHHFDPLFLSIQEIPSLSDPRQMTFVINTDGKGSQVVVTCKARFFAQARCEENQDPRFDPIRTPKEVKSR